MDANIKKSLLTLDSPTPRYTSYPTAPHFESDLPAQHYEHWLWALPEDSTLSLYVHIPFCAQLCWFCGCHTKITKRYDPVSAYLPALLQEISLTASHCKTEHTVTSIHFGGGSPTMLEAQDFLGLMNGIKQAFSVSPNAQISVEIDPRTLTEARVAAYARSGVNRASIGVQDFYDTVMKAVNRFQPFSTTYRAVALLREYGITALNLDLMYGLPHQTPETIERTANLAATLKPDRMSLFGYAHVPWMKKHMRLIPPEALPAPSDRLDLFHASATVLTEAGYIPIGIDHFVRPEDSLARALRAGTLRRNFQGYTEDNATALLGFGPSAISRLPYNFTQNMVPLSQWHSALAQNTLPVNRHLTLSAEDRLREDVIQTLMCYLTVNIQDICEGHGFPTDHFSSALEKLGPMEAMGLVQVSPEGGISILHRHAARPVCAVFDAYFTPASNTQRHVTIT